MRDVKLGHKFEAEADKHSRPTLWGHGQSQDVKRGQNFEAEDSRPRHDMRTNGAQTPNHHKCIATKCYHTMVTVAPDSGKRWLFIHVMWRASG